MKVRIQFIAPARKAAEHGIVAVDKFDQRETGSHVSREVDDFGERNTLGREHVVYHGEHQDHVETAAGGTRSPIEKRGALEIPPTGGRRRLRQIHHQRKNIQLLGGSLPPDLACHGGIAIDGGALRRP